VFISALMLKTLLAVALPVFVAIVTSIVLLAMNNDALNRAIGFLQSDVSSLCCQLGQQRRELIDHEFRLRLHYDKIDTLKADVKSVEDYLAESAESGCDCGDESGPVMSALSDAISDISSSLFGLSNMLRGMSPCRDGETDDADGDDADVDGDQVTIAISELEELFRRTGRYCGFQTCDDRNEYATLSRADMNYLRGEVACDCPSNVAVAYDPAVSLSR
jgi:hypothetical protein